MTLGVKHDGGKPRLSLLPWAAVLVVVEVLEYGAKKYAPDNWRHVPDARRRYFDAAMRHLTAWWSGERADAETGLSHLAHAACCVLFLLALELEGTNTRLANLAIGSVSGNVRMAGNSGFSDSQAHAFLDALGHSGTRTILGNVP